MDVEEAIEQSGNRNKMDNDPNKRKNRKKRKNFLKNAKKYAKKGQMGRGTKMSEDLYQYFVGILDSIKEGIENAEERYALVNNVLERTKGEELNVVSNQLGSRVIELLLPYSSPEDLERFIEVLSPELRKLCSDNFTSHIIETLLRVSCNRATEHLQNDENGSDLEEEVLKKKAKLETKNEPKYSEEHRQACYDFTLKICKYALNNLEDFVWDSYANHILRSALKCLSGITLLPGEKPKVNLFKETVQDNKGIPPHQTKMCYNNVPEEFKEIVKEFTNRLSSWPQFKDLPYKNITSALLQVMLYAIKNVDKKLTTDLTKQLLDESFAPDDWVSTGQDEKKESKDDVENSESVVPECSLPPVFESESAVRLLEAALFVSKKKTYTQIYVKCFINRLGQLSSMPMLNFTVQRLFDNCRVKEEFEPMFDEVASKFEALLACGNTGVLVAVAKACLRMKVKQTQFVTTIPTTLIQNYLYAEISSVNHVVVVELLWLSQWKPNLESALKCSEQEKQKYFSVLCLRLQPADKVDLAALDKTYFIHIHGSVILQTVLDFQRPAKAVTSLLELSSEELLVIFTDAKGCHIADAFCKGQFVGVKARDKMIWKLKGYYQKLALSQYGSRALEQIFEVASAEQKVKIMTELSEKSNLLNGTPYGRLIASKLDVATFKLSQKKWEQIWGKNKS